MATATIAPSADDGEPRTTAIQDWQVRQIRRLRFRDHFSIRRIAQITRLSKGTVAKYCGESGKDRLPNDTGDE